MKRVVVCSDKGQSAVVYMNSEKMWQWCVQRMAQHHPNDTGVGDNEQIAGVFRREARYESHRPLLKIRKAFTFRWAKGRYIFAAFPPQIRMLRLNVRHGDAIPGSQMDFTEFLCRLNGVFKKVLAGACDEGRCFTGSLQRAGPYSGEFQAAKRLPPGKGLFPTPLTERNIRPPNKPFFFAGGDIAMSQQIEHIVYSPYSARTKRHLFKPPLTASA